MATHTPKDGSNFSNTWKESYLQVFIAQLKARRGEIGLSAEHLGYKLGVADRLVNKWECGDRVPSAFMLHIWCASLDCEIKLVRTSTPLAGPTTTKKVPNETTR